MFGLTRREQYWKAQERAAEIAAGLAAVAIKSVADTEIARAKVNAQELESLRAEVAAYRAQESKRDDGSEMSHEETTPKVTGAPDEIYLCYGELIHDDTHQNLRTHEDDVTWCEDRQEPSDVRYVRADLVEWQPIETAPRDGTPVDLWHKDGFRVTEQWWEKSDSTWSGLAYDHFTHWRPITEPGAAPVAPVAPDWRVEAAKWLRARQDQPEWLAQAIEAAP
jgi:hypothetical protein